MDMLAPYLPGLALAVSAFLLSILSPGPNVLAILGTSMATGRPAGLALALGIATGSFVWATLTMLGLSALIASFAVALTAIKIAGGGYLLWLAYKAFRSAASVRDPALTRSGGADLSRSAAFRRGLIVQMSNPKAALAWIAILSLGLQADAPAWVGLLLVGLTTFLSVVIHCLYALAFSTPPMVRFYKGTRRIVQTLLGTFFAVAGLKLLTSRA